MNEEELIIAWQEDNPHISFKTWLILTLNVSQIYIENQDTRIEALKRTIEAQAYERDEWKDAYYERTAERDKARRDLQEFLSVTLR